MANRSFKVKYYFLVLAVFLFGSVFGEIEELSNDEKISLKTFLRVLFEDSEAGYVLFNKKPICIHGYFFNDPFRVDSENYKESIALKKGARVWKKINNKNSDTIIHISETKDPQIPGYAHVLVINKPLFHQVVNENLSLFQYILGPLTTSQKLLDALVVEDHPFHALLKYDKVLIGIILGFGTQNSIFESRMENIFEASDKENPPFLYANSIYREFEQEHLPFPSSFGFKTTQEEVKNYFENLVVSSQNLQEKKPNFIFGWHKEDVKNKKRIADLEETQDKIQKLLHSENFEINILEKLIGKNDFLKSRATNFSPTESINFKNYEINKVIAKGLWEFLQHDIHAYLPYFMEGMKNPDSITLKVDRLAYFSNYLTDYIEAKENLEKANSYFQSLNNSKDLQSVLLNKLYYKTIDVDENKITCKGSLVTVTYSIYSPLGHHISDGFHEEVNLKNTIPGFAHGVMGMHIGETREIFIHPSLAYGFDSSDLDKCIYLKATVTLEKVHNEGTLPEIKPLNLDFLLDAEVLKSREINYKNGLMAKGAMISSHLKKCKEIDTSVVRDYLMKFYHNKKEYEPTTQDEQGLINDVHWQIYFSTAGLQ